LTKVNYYGLQIAPAYNIVNVLMVDLQGTDQKTKQFQNQFDGKFLMQSKIENGFILHFNFTLKFGGAGPNIHTGLLRALT